MCIVVYNFIEYDFVLMRNINWAFYWNANKKYIITNFCNQQYNIITKPLCIRHFLERFYILHKKLSLMYNDALLKDDVS